MNKEKAKKQFRDLIAQYGLKWDATVPRKAYEELNQINQFLTEQDRREVAQTRR